MYLFNRSITINVRSDDEQTVTVDGFLLDTHHELCLTLGVDLKSNTITSAKGQFCRVPHTECEQSQQLINNLIGVNLNHNVRKQIQVAVGLNYGCTHITDLTLECVKGLLQARFRLMHLTMQEDEIKVLVQQYLEGSCMYYK